jgi:hypothetical protein
MCFEGECLPFIQQHIGGCTWQTADGVVHVAAECTWTPAFFGFLIGMAIVGLLLWEPWKKEAQNANQK